MGGLIETQFRSTNVSGGFFVLGADHAFDHAFLHAISLHLSNFHPYTVKKTGEETAQVFGS